MAGKANDNGPLVGFSFGLTKNLGSYNSLRIDYWHQDYIRPDETVDDAKDRVWDHVDSTVAEKLAEANETMEG